MSTLSHMALWTKDLERSRAFYEHWFGGVAGTKYVNSEKGFNSYFMSFGEGVRLELMSISGLESPADAGDKVRTGWAHIAFTVGDRSAVNRLTRQMKLTGFRVVGEPRETGDGYYESVILDPDGNRVELVAER